MHVPLISEVLHLILNDTRISAVFQWMVSFSFLMPSFSEGNAWEKGLGLNRCINGLMICSAIKQLKSVSCTKTDFGPFMLLLSCLAVMVFSIGIHKGRHIHWLKNCWWKSRDLLTKLLLSWEPWTLPFHQKKKVAYIQLSARSAEQCAELRENRW